MKTFFGGSDFFLSSDKNEKWSELSEMARTLIGKFDLKKKIFRGGYLPPLLKEGNLFYIQFIIGKAKLYIV